MSTPKRNPVEPRKHIKPSPHLRSSPARTDESHEVYRHLAAHGPRDMGHTRNGDNPSIPYVTYRTLEEVTAGTPRQTREEYAGYDPKTGKSKYRTVPVGTILENAQSHINCGKIPAISTGARQARLKRDADTKDGNASECCPTQWGYGYPSSPVPLAGQKPKRRY